MTVHTPRESGTLTPFQNFLLVILAGLAFLAFWWMTVDALDWQWERYEEEAKEFRESLAAQGIFLEVEPMDGQSLEGWE